MSNRTKDVLSDALALEPEERAALVSELLASLCQPDPRIDQLWVRESVDRLAAYDSGEMKAFPAEDVFRELDHP